MMRPCRRLGHLRQTHGVGAHRLHRREHPIVTRDLTFQLELLRDEERRRVPPKCGDDEPLHEVAPIVTTPQVRQFVETNLLDFAGRETLQQIARNENHRIEEPDCDRNVDLVAHAQPHGTPAFARAIPLRHRVAVLDR